MPLDGQGRAGASRSRLDRPASDEAGQAATELALVLPLLVLLLLAVVQVTLVARDQVLVVHAAREAAREAAVDPRPSAVRQAAIRAGSGLKVDRLGTETRQTGGAPVIVIVEVAYRAPTDVALIGPLLPDIEVRAKAAMRQETPRGLGKVRRRTAIRQEVLHPGANLRQKDLGSGPGAR